MASEGRYERLVQRRDRLNAEGLERRLRRVQPLGPTRAVVDGREVLLFCSNDYLGLAQHPEVMAASTGAGSGGSRLISGTRPIHLELEAALEEFFGRPALLFPSGYHANLALLSTVLQPEDQVASDALNHASIIDALRLSRCQRQVIPHLSTRVEPHTRLIAVEGLFSMDGDVPDLRSYPKEPWLFVDEAHSFGCLGEGRGAAFAAGVEPDFLVATLGKALGSGGAFVVGPPELKALMISAARPFVYTTALPEGVAAAALVALRLADAERRERLANNARLLRSWLAEEGVEVLGEAHILPVRAGSEAMALAEALLEEGIYAPGIRYPTVPRGQERVRLTVSAAHSEAELEQCVAAFGRARRRVRAQVGANT